MNDTDFLLALIPGLYALECLVHVPPDGLLILSWTGRSAALRGPGLHLKNPLLFGHACRWTRTPAAWPENPSLHKLNARWEEYISRSLALRWTSRALVAVVAVGWVLALMKPMMHAAWLALGGAFLLLHFAAALLFRRAHKALYPDDASHRTLQTLLCLISPWQSARSVDLLCENLLKDFHPLVAARRLLTPAAFKDLCRRKLLTLRYPSPQDSRNEGSDREEEKRFTDWIKRQGMGVEELLRSPEKTDPAGRSFCRRCLVEYVLEEGTCGDCGRALEKF